MGGRLRVGIDVKSSLGCLTQPLASSQRSGNIWDDVASSRRPSVADLYDVVPGLDGDETQDLDASNRHTRSSLIPDQEFIPLSGQQAPTSAFSASSLFSPGVSVDGGLHDEPGLASLFSSSFAAAASMDTEKDSEARQKLLDERNKMAAEREREMDRMRKFWD